MTPLMLIGQIVAGGCIAITIFVTSLIAYGERSTGVIENIDGIPFQEINNTTVITEKLAHTDIFLKEPVLGKKADIRVTFDPKDLETLKVGIRENEFWLSYPTIELYNAATETATGSITKELSIPLTDKLQETDRSLDLMFFATASDSTTDVDEGVDDSVLWNLHSFEVSTAYAKPSLREIKDYIKSIVYKERAL